MISTRRGILAALPLAALIALTGCSGGGGTGEGSGSESGSSGAGASVATCAPGHTWNADVPDMASQLLAHLQANGSPATSATGTGTQVMEWGTDGHVTLTTDYIFTVVSPLDDGLTLTLKQTHSGVSTGTLTIAGDVATSTGWDSSGYTVNNVVDINGTTTDAGTFPVPDTGLDGVPLTITCSGNVLTTFAQGGFVTTKWDNFG